MSVLRTAARLLGNVVTTIAKTVGGMSGAKTFDHDDATAGSRRSAEYRP